MPALRPALLTDIPEILRIQALCYTSIEPERASAYANKLAIAPDCAFVVEEKNAAGLLAYVFALPIQLAKPPALDADDLTVPAAADSLYLHDLAIDPAARGLKLSQPLMQAFFRAAQQRQLAQASLIAIQGSQPFWQRYGFHSEHPVSQQAEVQKKIRVYGDALYMTRQLAGHR